MDLGFLTPSDKTDALGRLGHYDILEIIGRGGMGIVLRAFDEKLHRVVAIKVMAAQLATNAAARKRFRREAQAQAAISHDHVVTIHAVEDASLPASPGERGNALPYLVMQYVSGKSLQERLDKSGPLQLAEIVRIGMQTAAGLAAAHNQGLIHRDIKPANILLENGVDRVKITDFGLARAAADASLTQSGVVVGTPQYMSPEQAEGKPVDHRSDLFSLGSVLYAMCAGRAPFRAIGSMAILKRVCEETPTPIRDINPDVPDWLATIVAKLHAKDPAERHQSAAEVAELLGRHLVHLQHPSVVPLPASMKIVDQRSRIEDQGSILNPQSSILKRRWAIATAVFVSLFGGLALTEATGITNLRATVIRIFTPEGTLIVETNDPAVKVTVEGDGDLVITGAGAQEVRLRPGSYKVHATKDGKSLKLDRDLVKIERGGKEIVRVRLEGGAPSGIAAVIITDTLLVGSFTLSVKLPGAKEAIVRKYKIKERLASKTGDLGKGLTRKSNPLGWLQLEVSPGLANKLILKRLWVNVRENWGHIRGKSLGFTTGKTDFPEPRLLHGMKLTTATGEIPLFFDETAGLDAAEIMVTGALKIQSTGGKRK
jgi:serine/threonine protein kinase